MKETFRASIARGATYESDDPLGDQLRELDENLGLVNDPADYALEQMKLWHKMMGKEWDDTPVTEGFVTDRKGNTVVTHNVGMAELNVEYTSMNDLNQKLARGGK